MESGKKSCTTGFSLTTTDPKIVVSPYETRTEDVVRKPTRFTSILSSRPQKSVDTLNVCLPVGLIISIFSFLGKTPDNYSSKPNEN